MKIAIAADLHLRGSDLDCTRNQLRALVEQSQGCELLIVCGDIFDQPSIKDGHAETGAIAEVAVETVAAFASPRGAILLPGNHDYAGPGRKDALHVFDGVPGVSVVRAPERVQYGDLTLAVVPWMYDGGIDASIMGRGCDLFVGHLRIGGALMGRTVAYEPKAGDWCISRAELDAVPARHVALGDFHRRQDLTGHGGYVGALRQQNFGEEGNPQGFEILDTETWDARWVELGCCPRYRTVELEAGDPVPVQGDNERLRVNYLCAPDTDEVRELESQGVVVRQVVEREERIARAELPAGVMQDKRALMRLWAGAQNPVVSEERVAKMIHVWEATP